MYLNGFILNDKKTLNLFNVVKLSLNNSENNKHSTAFKLIELKFLNEVTLTFKKRKSSV